ncbi:beta-N-acetylglucosaminidase domain-containing protein [Heyndrickxia sp. NPDC080065]|uniref:protein O-GlcNAcase n=1 Tax=Heyndrickxia sp. NPDC080065 TaxID=3390568 RepID=UPI003D06F1C8
MDIQYAQYYFRDYYHTGEFTEIKGRKLVCELQSRYSMNQEYEGVISSNLIEIITEEHKGNIKLTFEYSASLKEDGYILKVENDQITVTARNKRGIKYAIDALGFIIIKKEGVIRLPIVTIHDEPSFRIRGIIEGFYGEPWSFEDRMDSVSFMAKHRMNTFMYAPKDDEYHRKLWRESYPEENFKRIQLLKQHCDENNIDFYYCISPGNDMKFTSKEDFGYLKEKLRAMISLGIRNFAILMDDIDYVLKGENKDFFERSGVSHAYLVNEVNRFLKDTLYQYNLVMCPSEYWSYWDTEYKKDIRDLMDPEVLVFWTGFFVFAPTIDQEHAQNNRSFYGHDFILWDNIPVNDADPDRIFLGPVRNRYSKLNELGHIGFVSNPMNQWELSKMSLITLSHYMWNCERYMPEYSWELALKEFAPEFVEDMRFFCENNENSRLYFKVNEELMKAIETKNILYLDSYFSRFSEAILHLKTMDNSKFQTEIKPWFERAEMDIHLWKLIKTYEETKTENVQQEIQKWISQSKTYPCRIGSDVAMKVADKWGYLSNEKND